MDHRVSKIGYALSPNIQQQEMPCKYTHGMECIDVCVLTMEAHMSYEGLFWSLGSSENLVWIPIVRTIVANNR